VKSLAWQFVNSLPRHHEFIRPRNYRPTVTAIAAVKGWRGVAVASAQAMRMAKLPITAGHRTTQ